MAMLREGDEGPAIENLQKHLNSVGCQCVVDGLFGPATKQAVINFQKGFGLDADGVVGPKTLEALQGAQPAS